MVEALRAGRHAIGITDGHRGWATARANVTAAKHHGARPDGMVLERGPDALATAHLSGLTGQVALVLTTLRPRPCLVTPPPNGDTGNDPAARSAARLRVMLTHCRRLLAPGGHVIITTRPSRCHGHGHLLDLPGHILAAGRAAGLIPIERCIALTGALRGDRLIVRASWRSADGLPASSGPPGIRTR